MKVTVLMLGHRAGVGKDSCAKFLQEYGYKRRAFADKLKSVVADLYNFNEDQMHGSTKDTMDLRYRNMIDQPTIAITEQAGSMHCDINNVDYPVEAMTIVPNPDWKEYFTPRRILQIFGQQQRQIYPDIWAQYVFNQVDKDLDVYRITNTNLFYVISDFRFRNEYDVALNWKNSEVEGYEKQLYCVRIDRPGTIAKSGAGDISEHDLDDFQNWDNIIIKPNINLDDLREEMYLFHKNVVLRF
jgi:hypothetical protein